MGHAVGREILTCIFKLYEEYRSQKERNRIEEISDQERRRHLAYIAQSARISMPTLCLPCGMCISYGLQRGTT